LTIFIVCAIIHLSKKLCIFAPVYRDSYEYALPIHHTS